MLSLVCLFYKGVGVKWTNSQIRYSKDKFYIKAEMSFGPRAAYLVDYIAFSKRKVWQLIGLFFVGSLPRK